MSFTVDCTCGKKYRLADSSAGKTVSCKACGAKIRVPSAVVAPPVPVASNGGIDLSDLSAAAYAEKTAAAVDRPAPAPRSSATDDATFSSGQQPPRSAERITQFLGGTDAETFASRTPQMTVNFLRYYFHHWNMPVLLSIFLAFAVLLANIPAESMKPEHRAHMWALPAAVVTAALGVTILNIVRTFAKFRKGDLCPGVVVSVSPPRVAVLTDLAAGNRAPKRVVKVVAAPLFALPGGAVKIGTRLAMVALYQGPLEYDCWKDFMPEPVACGTASAHEAQRRLAAFKESEWQTLENFIDRLPSTGVKLYTL